tara:strand:+ start:2287 stop:2490 length:204 start_codon:yes stop_codon:yes gene_type:complete
MTEIYETRYYSIGLINDEQNIVGIATDLKVSFTSDGTVDEFHDKLKECFETYDRESIIWEETFPENE